MTEGKTERDKKETGLAGKKRSERGGLRRRVVIEKVDACTRVLFTNLDSQKRST